MLALMTCLHLSGVMFYYIIQANDRIKVHIFCNRAATFKHPVKPEGSVWMEKSLLKNIIICFPEVGYLKRCLTINYCVF